MTVNRTELGRNYVTHVAAAEMDAQWMMGKFQVFWFFLVKSRLEGIVFRTGDASERLMVPW